MFVFGESRNNTLGVKLHLLLDLEAIWVLVRGNYIFWFGIIWPGLQSHNNYYHHNVQHEETYFQSTSSCSICIWCLVSIYPTYHFNWNLIIHINVQKISILVVTEYFWRKWQLFKLKSEFIPMPNFDLTSISVSTECVLKLWSIMFQSLITKVSTISKEKLNKHTELEYSNINQCQ